MRNFKKTITLKCGAKVRINKDVRSSSIDIHVSSKPQEALGAIVYQDEDNSRHLSIVMSVEGFPKLMKLIKELEKYLKKEKV